MHRAAAGFVDAFEGEVDRFVVGGPGADGGFGGVVQAQGEVGHGGDVVVRVALVEVQGAQDADLAVLPVFEQGVDEALPAAEVVVERAAGDAEAPAQQADVESFESEFGQHLESGVEVLLLDDDS
ncbi:Uncharacterised protein [Mycobacteroides abscessus subsp. abscessus]|nr:Uncharacterised protein [Mycobacteroides abscessus subsp. abscessus]